MLVEVALPLPIPRTFTYRVPPDRATPGTRVRVPFSGRRMIGWIVGPAAREVPPDAVKPVDRVLDTTPSVPADLLELCTWVADYYVTPLGLVLRAALPTVLSNTARTSSPARTRRVVRLTRELPSLLQRESLFGRAARQRACYETIEASGGAVALKHLTERLGFSAAIARALVDKGVAELIDEHDQRDPFAGSTPLPAPSLTLTPAQAAAVRALCAPTVAAPAAPAPTVGPAPAATSATAAAVVPALAPSLLFGVTGSGKTLVYIELLKDVVRRHGRGAIVLVPEIALTPQTVARFRAHFGDVVAVLHSALSDGERYDAWRALRDGERRIAIGARSAIFAPVRDLGAIIVDEEHESSYKQSESPRYHAREVAVVRARLAGAACVLGSATPSLESWRNARAGKYALLELPERVEGRPLPAVEVVDLRTRARPAAAAQSHGGPGGTPPPRARAPILAPPLAAAIEARLDRGEQTILLLNRRGYASFVQCLACGEVWHCGQCNVSLTYHRARRRLVCHYCFHEEPAPTHCTACGSGDLSFRGVGTEQVERDVLERFPAARVARMDVDTTSGKWSHHEILGRVERREIDILLGTQMIAKGLDFPGVTLVGVINADVAMHLPDFRATERTFQLLTQVAGRAGRGDDAGQVYVQTALPQHYAIRAALTHDYRAFAERELEERAATRYPPHTRMANLVVSGAEETPTQDGAIEAARWTAAALEAGGAPVELIGPAPCPIDRIRGRWRWHFLLRSAHAGALGRICHHVQNDYPLRPGRAELRLIIDRDPVSLL